MHVVCCTKLIKCFFVKYILIVKYVLSKIIHSIRSFSVWKGFARFSRGFDPENRRRRRWFEGSKPLETHANPFQTGNDLMEWIILLNTYFTFNTYFIKKHFLNIVQKNTCMLWNDVHTYFTRCAIPLHSRLFQTDTCKQGHIGLHAWTCKMGVG